MVGCSLHVNVNVYHNQHYSGQRAEYNMQGVVEIRTAVVVGSTEVRQVRVTSCVKLAH